MRSPCTTIREKATQPWRFSTAKKFFFLSFKCSGVSNLAYNLTSVALLMVQSLWVHSAFGSYYQGSRRRQWHPLQYSCLESSMDGGAPWAAVHGVAKSRTRLKRLSSSKELNAGQNLCMLFPAYHLALLVHMVSKDRIPVFNLGSPKCQWVKSYCYTSKVSLWRSSKPDKVF